MNFQALLDEMSKGWAAQRALDGMTLGRMIEDLERLPPGRAVAGFGRLTSYRGHYEDLAFSPVNEAWDAERNPATVGELLAECREAMGKTYDGYKGGRFTMHKHTPLWVARWGSTGPRIVGLDTNSDPITPITQREEF
jgi:hypothetical protein